MKLIDILVEETIKNGWSWPERTNCITQDSDREIVSAGCHPDDAKFYPYRNGWNLKASRIESFESRILADDYTTAIITRYQYEAALAAKNDGWIAWGGGECPVPGDTEVLIKCKSEGAWDFRRKQRAGGVSWTHDDSALDVIAYRLHQPQKTEQPEASEEDLNECIGQAPVAEWNGEGLTPPVGCVCERSWDGDKWLQCEILFVGRDLIVVRLDSPGVEEVYDINSVTFRPIRTEAERKRDIATQSMNSVWREVAGKEVNGKLLSIYEVIYDAIAVGKIPGVKLED